MLTLENKILILVNYSRSIFKRLFALSLSSTKEGFIQLGINATSSIFNRNSNLQVFTRSVPISLLKQVYVYCGYRGLNNPDNAIRVISVLVQRLKFLIQSISIKLEVYNLKDGEICTKGRA